MTSPKDILSELVIQDLTNKPVQKMAGGKSVAPPAMKAALKKFSEFLGDVGAEGKTLLGTEADRTKVGGRFLGGPGFSGLQRTSAPHAQAGSVWGVDAPGNVTKMLNRDNMYGNETVWVPFIGSENMHKSNRMVNDSLYRAFLKSANEGNLTDDMRYRMNARLASRVDDNGNPIFDPNIDILDPDFRKKHLNTFAQRGAVSDIIGGLGLGKTKAQIIDYDKMLQSMADPLVRDAPTLSVGPRAFTLSGESVYRPDLNKSFPHIVTGEDLGEFMPVPGPEAFPDFTAQYANRLDKRGRLTPAGFMDYRASNPNQFISEQYLTDLQKLGKADGGSIQHMADGKLVKGGVNVIKKLFSNTDVLPAAERDANLAKFLEDSAIKERLYHATDKDFSKLKSKKDGPVFATPSTDFANEFAEFGNKEGVNIMPVYVQAKNPFDYYNAEHMKALQDEIEKLDASKRRAARTQFNKILLPTTAGDNWKHIESAAIQNAIKDLGHDSFYSEENFVKNLGMYNPNQIKSAIGNRGTYDINEADITKAEGGSIQHMADGKGVKALAHAISVPFTHFSNSPTLSVLDPARYGSGIKGAEAARLKFAPEIAPRSYVYSGTQAKPEAGLGPHKYHGLAENVYPLHTDPEGFRAKAQKMNELYPGSFDQQEALNDMERLIKRAGYSGYVNETGNYPAAVLFQQHPVIPAESLAGHPNIHHAIASKNAESMLGLRPGNTAEERAAAMGYDARQFHGTNQGEISAFDPATKLFSNPTGTFTSPDVQFANKYATNQYDLDPSTGIKTGHGATMMPLMTKTGTAFDPLSPEGQRVLAEYADEMGRSERHKQQMLGGGWEHMEDPDLINKLKDLGYTGTHVMESGVKNLATFDPKDLRSVNAAFDPAKAGSSDLLHSDGGLIGKAVGLLKKLGMTEADRAAWQAANKTSLRQTQDPIVAQAAKDLASKAISPDQYRAIVRERLPIKPYTEVPPMPTPNEMAGALHSNKLETGIVGQNLEIPHGARVASRLDIPAYNEYDKWIVSLHDAGKGNAIGYGQSAHLKGDDKPIEFITSPMGAQKIAANEMGKESFARIRGNWQSHDPQELYERAKALMTDPEWAQIGMNPYRHSYFYDKADMAPVTSADEVIQIGPLVLGKKVKKTSPDDPIFRIKKSDPDSPTFKKGGNIKVMKYEVLLNKAKK